MPARHRSVLTALLSLATMLPAAAQDVALPREPQIGPRPFYLVDKMKDGPLKTQLASAPAPSARPIFPSAIAARRWNFPSTPANPTSRPPAWARASSNAT